MIGRSSAGFMVGSVWALVSCGGASSDSGTVNAGGAAGSSPLGSAAGTADTLANGGRTSAAGGTQASAGGPSAAGGTDMSDPGSGTCATFTPCGGALLGTWRLDVLCTSPDILLGLVACPTATAELTGSGTITFRPDGTLDNSQIQLSTNVVLPASCVAPPASCSSVSGGAYGTCVAAADGNCQCSTSSQPSEASPVTYLASGSQIALVTTRAGGSILNQTAYYCVQGNQLLLRGRLGKGAYVYTLTRQ